MSNLHVVLRNEVVYDADTLSWLSHYDGAGLSRDQRRLLAWGHSHGGAFTSREYQKLVGTDIYGASQDIKDLIRRGLAVSQRKGGRVYRILESAAPQTVPEELAPLLPLLRERGFIKNADVRRVLGVTSRQALVLLTEWAKGEWLIRDGERKATVYRAGRLLQLWPSLTAKS
jgi:Fic family protein